LTAFFNETYINKQQQSAKQIPIKYVDSAEGKSYATGAYIELTEIIRD
jgi:hypothetical protein